MREIVMPEIKEPTMQDIVVSLIEYTAEDRGKSKKSPAHGYPLFFDKWDMRIVLCRLHNKEPYKKILSDFLFNEQGPIPISGDLDEVMSSLEVSLFYPAGGGEHRWLGWPDKLKEVTDYYSNAGGIEDFVSLCEDFKKSMNEAEKNKIMSKKSIKDKQHALAYFNLK